MTLVDEYEKQAGWRRWDDALSRTPLSPGQRVLDLGCSVGVVTAQLAHAGADVIGVDTHEALLARARERNPGLRFEQLDIGALEPATFGVVDGIWASFVAAYFADLHEVVARWRSCVRAGGWLALVEIDDLLGHEPRSRELAADLAGFYAWARANRGYGFEHGRALAPALRAAGAHLVHEGTLDDDELAFTGAASPDVIDAWRMRLARMGGMKAHFGERFADVERQILASLASPAHRSLCRVVIAVGRC